jgi:O-antigen ligase
LGGCLFGSMLLNPVIGKNLAVVDPALALVILLGGYRLAQRRTPATLLFRSSVPWLWVIFVGSLVSLFGLGLTSWAVDNFARDVFAFGLFFGAFQLALDARRHLDKLWWVVLATVVLLIFLLLTEGDEGRAQATFYNPNYAGHFLAMGTLYLVFAKPGKYARQILLIGFGALAILKTGSFGSMAMLWAGVAYIFWAAFRRVRNPLAKLGFAGLLGLCLVSAWNGFQELENRPSFEVNESVTSERFEQTGKGRLRIYHEGFRLARDHPWGVGPAGVASQDLLGRGQELHNDFLGYLVERGLLGLVGLVGLSWALWKRSRRFGAARLMLIVILVGGLFRETLHFRHLWLFLALAFAYDYYRGEERAVSAAAREPAASTI